MMKAREDRDYTNFCTNCKIFYKPHSRNRAKYCGHHIIRFLHHRADLRSFIDEILMLSQADDYYDSLIASI